MANGKDTSMDDQVDAKLERRGGFFSFFLSSPLLRLRFTNTRCTFSLKTSSSSYSPRYFDDIGDVKNKYSFFVGEMGDSTTTSLQSGTTVSYLPYLDISYQVPMGSGVIGMRSLPQIQCARRR